MRAIEIPSHSAPLPHWARALRKDDEGAGHPRPKSAGIDPTGIDSPAKTQRRPQGGPAARYHIDHRRGKRWTTDLMAQLSLAPGGTRHPARLVNLSSHGAGVRLESGRISAGTTAEVWLSDEREPVRALVIHARKGLAGLLWCAQPPAISRLLRAVSDARRLALTSCA